MTASSSWLRHLWPPGVSVRSREAAISDPPGSSSGSRQHFFFLPQTCRRFLCSVRPVIHVCLYSPHPPQELLGCGPDDMSLKNGEERGKSNDPLHRERHWERTILQEVKRAKRTIRYVGVTPSLPRLLPGFLPPPVSSTRPARPPPQFTPFPPSSYFLPARQCTAAPPILRCVSRSLRKLHF